MKEKFNKIINFFNKTSYIIQFVITLVFSIAIYKLMSIKAIDGYFNKIYLVISILLGIITLAIMIYHIIRDGKKIEKMFLNFSILISLLYLVFMIPSQVPDEQAHMLKAYEVSKGIFITKINEDGSAPVSIPKELVKYNHNIMNKYSVLNEQFGIKTNYNEEVQEISGAQGYVSILYFAPALGLFLARIIGANLITGIYLGKLFNLILFITLGYFSIKKIPFGKIVLAVYLLMPMMLQQAVSFSADCFINAIAMYFIAYVMNLLYRETRITKKELIFYCILSVILSMAKMVYMPLVGIGMILIFRKNISKKDKIIFITISIVLSIAFSLGSYVLSNKYSVAPSSMKEYAEQMNVNGTEQMKQMIKNPVSSVKLLVKDFYYNVTNYIRLAVGSELGWLEIKPSQTLISLYILILLASAIIEKNNYEIKKLEKVWILLICIGVTVLIQLAMYWTFTPLGANFIGGVQGRYFIPIIILVLLCISKKDNYIKIKNPELKMLIIASVINLFVIQNIYSFFS